MVVYEDTGLIKKTKYPKSHKFVIFYHKETKHEGMRYICDQCDNTFARFHVLNRHRASKHDGMRYNCTKCSATFSWKSSIFKHNKLNHVTVSYHFPEDKLLNKSVK